jgi:hypothetical protein
MLEMSRLYIYIYRFILAKMMGFGAVRVRGSEANNKGMKWWSNKSRREGKVAITAESWKRGMRRGSNEVVK